MVFPETLLRKSPFATLSLHLYSIHISVALQGVQETLLRSQHGSGLEVPSSWEWVLDYGPSPLWITLSFPGSGPSSGCIAGNAFLAPSPMRLQVLIAHSLYPYRPYT
uniref:Uncharacterized protein n=1 Tax=Eutreptiella gymnastica TaxID=73025 RepID=A0A7S1N709_9EUGL|mmetsp:Transcript_127669/g.220756  ORF Transcript_127669/g.220756 Transcript_127669/m.220756 type:complete len:107 (+) Transcript_127669:740-1060(+)